MRSSEQRARHAAEMRQWRAARRAILAAPTLDFESATCQTAPDNWTRKRIDAIKAKVFAGEGRILDFDIENRPLTYLGGDFTTSEITAISASFGPDQPVYTWLLGEDDPLDMLTEFVELYNQADMVTGHYIRGHDLPIIQGAMLEYGLPPLSPKLTCDTKMDLRILKGVSKSQESLSDMLGIVAPKIKMTQADWRAANRLQRVDLARVRCEADVRQHQRLRMELSRLGYLRQPRMWAVMQ